MSHESRLAELLKTATHIIGVDEVGMGAWAGPAYVCAVAVAKNWLPPKELTDSKKVRPAKREELFYNLQSRTPHSLVSKTSEEIDHSGLGTSHREAVLAACAPLLHRFPESVVVIDGDLDFEADFDRVLSIPKADASVPAVSLASVFAKFTRDKEMAKLGRLYPGYGLGIHMGYGTPDHQAALDKLGPSPIHRKSYKPIEKFEPKQPLGPEPGMWIDGLGSDLEEEVV